MFLRILWDHCETTSTLSFYGNYSGTMICQGDTIVTQIKVVESLCPKRSELIFNDGEFIAIYWKTIPLLRSNSFFDQPAIQVRHRDSEPIKFLEKTGTLTIDSLIFWFKKIENSPDTCFYVGARI